MCTVRGTNIEVIIQLTANVTQGLGDLLNFSIYFLESSSFIYYIFILHISDKYMYAYDIMMYIHVLSMITNVWYKEEFTKIIQTFNLNSSSLMFS